MHLLDSSGVLGALGFVFILALFLGLIWVMRKVTGAIGSKVNQVISPGAHRAGQQAAGTSYRFVSETVDAQEIVARIYQSLAFPASETPVHTTTCAVRKFRDADGDIEIRYGKKLGGDLWRCVVLAIGEAVDYIVPEVTRVDGLVPGARDLADVEAAVVAAAQAAAPDVTVMKSVREVSWK